MGSWYFNIKLQTHCSSILNSSYALSVWAGLMFKVCGLSATFQVYWPMGLHISIWAGTPASSGLASAYLYLDVHVKWTKIVIVAHISDWDSSTFTKIGFDRGS